MLKLFKNLNKRDYIFLLLTVLLIVFQVFVELKMPDYMSQVTRLAQTPGSDMNEIIKNGFFMLLCALASLVTLIVTGYLTANIAASFSRNTRKALFDKVERLSVADVKKFKTSSLITRTTNDITQLQMLFAMGTIFMIKSPVTAVWAIMKILNKSTEWSIATGVGVVILLTTIFSIMIVVSPKFKKVQKLTDNLNGVTRESLTGIRVIRAFNAEEYQENKFSDINDDLTRTNLFIQKTFAIMGPMMNIVMHGLTLAIYLIGALLISKAMLYDKLTIFSNMVVFSSYGMQVIMSFLMLAMIFMLIPRASVSAERINEVLESDISIKEGTLEKGKANQEGTIEFKNVSFKYPDGDDDMLKNISFEVKKGETVAFIGSTGSGKTTLVNLIPRFYDVTGGEVLVNGVNVKEYKEEALHNIIGYIPQKAVLFDGTVNYNISYGKNDKKKVTEEKIKEAINVAQAKDFVEKMEDGYESHIAQGGTNISGGQKQRLSIARAIARDPEIYIFDDTFSALDYKTDSTLRKELKKYVDGATVLIVAQRIGTIMNADKIIVLNDGECVGQGTHKELLKNCDVYKQIALSQLSEEEL
ncbi:MAG: ABC transporter ATP-binding protein/permease [Bacilli bacterium]|nr:ABC transporter ATP-binding protein/permease [Bacilli bacterium]